MTFGDPLLGPILDPQGGAFVAHGIDGSLVIEAGLGKFTAVELRFGHG